MNIPTKSRILLIGWDAADWKFINPLLDAGLMPNLTRIVDNGVIANLASLNPTLSPILWTSIATGKTGDKHGILGFVEPNPEGGVRLSTSTSRKTKAIWNIFSQSGLRSVIVNWYASHPAEPIKGSIISQRFFEGLPADPKSDWQVLPQSVHPTSLGEVISPFRMHPAELNLSDLSQFIPDINKIDLGNDPRPTILAHELAKTVSIHSVATGAMEAEEWDFMAVYYDAIDTLGHHFMPHHPPKMAHISKHDFGMYQHVMRECYLYHDQMLGRLLDLAGPETYVILVSDHGFHSDHLRPQFSTDNCSEAALAANWHRHYGILAMSGPGIKQDERIYGTTLLDITPTLLTMMNLPVGKDMDGNVLQQAFEQPISEIESVDSWDTIAGESGMLPPDVHQVMNESPAAIAQLVALGYLPQQANQDNIATEIAMAESQFNLAVILTTKGDHSRALKILKELRLRYPDNDRYALSVAKTYANLKEHENALQVLDEIQQMGQQNAESEILKIAELFNAGRIDEAEQHLESYQQKYPTTSYFYVILGNIQIRRNLWRPAFEALKEAEKMDADDPHIQFQLSFVANQLGEFNAAVDHALEAIGRLYFYPQAHYQLGVALKGLGDLPRAIRSLNLAVSQAPQLLDAHYRLAEIYEQTDNKGLWLRHQRLAKGLPADH